MAQEFKRNGTCRRSRKLRFDRRWRRCGNALYWGKTDEIHAEVCLADLDKDVVDFRPNFDETEKEPLVLPMRVPNLLVNGAEGIAMGMATSIPPHNLGEVIDAVKAYIKTKRFDHYKTTDEIHKGLIFRQAELLLIKMIWSIYETDRKIKVRGKVETEELKGGKSSLWSVRSHTRWSGKNREVFKWYSRSGRDKRKQQISQIFQTNLPKKEFGLCWN